MFVPAPTAELDYIIFGREKPCHTVDRYEPIGSVQSTLMRRPGLLGRGGSCDRVAQEVE